MSYSKQRNIAKFKGTLSPEREITLSQASEWVLQWLREKSGLPLADNILHKVSFSETNKGARVRASYFHDVKTACAYQAFELSHPCSQVPGRSWSTEILLRQNGQLDLCLRLKTIMAGGNTAHDNSYSIPRLFRDLSENPGVLVDGLTVKAKPKFALAENDYFEFFNLLEGDRLNPVIVLSAVPSGGQSIHGVAMDAERLSRQLMGLAHVYVISPAISQLLTEKYGKMMSVYNGAVRIYNSDFNPSNPNLGFHPIWLPRTIAETPPKSLETAIARYVFEESVGQKPYDKDLPPFAAIETLALQELIAQVPAPLPSPVIFKIGSSLLVPTEKTSDLEQPVKTPSDPDLSRQIEQLKAKIERLENERENLNKLVEASCDEANNAMALAIHEEEQRKTAEAKIAELELDKEGLKAENEGLRLQLRHAQSAKSPEAFSLNDEISTVLGPDSSYDGIAQWANTGLQDRIVIPGKAVKALSGAVYDKKEAVIAGILILAGAYRDLRLADQANINGEDHKRLKDQFLTQVRASSLYLTGTLKARDHRYKDNYVVVVDGERYPLDQELKRGEATIQEKL